MARDASVQGARCGGVFVLVYRLETIVSDYGVPRAGTVQATPIFSINVPGKELPSLGAFHGAEVPFVFGDPFELSTPGELHLSNAMGCFWSNFAETGDPNEGRSSCAAKLRLPHWPSAGLGDNIILFSNTSIVNATGHNSDRCDLFARFA